MSRRSRSKLPKVKKCAVVLEDVLQADLSQQESNGSIGLQEASELCPNFDIKHWEDALTINPNYKSGCGGNDDLDDDDDDESLSNLLIKKKIQGVPKFSEVCVAQIEEELTSEILCRRNEIRKVLGLIGQCKNQLPQSIFIYGHSGTGKSFLLERILQKLKYKYVVVDCVQCYMPKLLYTTILNAAADHSMSIDNNYEPFASCDNFLDFTLNLKKAMNSDSFIIILDKCERLRSMSKTTFVRLKQLTGLNICVILLSNIIPETFYSPKGYFDTIPLYFKQYTKDEIYQILSANHPWEELDTLYKNYLKLFLGVFYGSCRDLCELKYMVNYNFSKHSKSMAVGTSEMHKLWQVAIPHLKSSLEELYQRTAMCRSEPENNLLLVSNFSTNIVAKNRDHLSSQEFALSFELPYYSKYFLISAYLASYIPSKLDKALFVKQKDKKKKKRVSRSKHDILSDMLLGPKPFTVDRLLAIFYSIVDGEVSFTVNLSVQISSLVKLRLLTVVNNNIDCPKYKCAVGLEFIKTIARTVSFDIVRYLFPPK